MPRSGSGHCTARSTATGTINDATKSALALNAARSFPFPVSSSATPSVRKRSNRRAAGPFRQESQPGRVPAAEFHVCAAETPPIAVRNQIGESDLMCRPAAIPPPLVLGRGYGRSRLRSAAPVSFRDSTVRHCAAGTGSLHHALHGRVRGTSTPRGAEDHHGQEK